MLWSLQLHGLDGKQVEKQLKPYKKVGSIKLLQGRCKYYYMQRAGLP